MVLYSLLGLCQSESYKKTRRIDIEIKKEAIITSNIIKLLLLGSAECGKSTLLKQMKYVFYSQDFPRFSWFSWFSSFSFFDFLDFYATVADKTLGPKGKYGV
jgi:GTPase SAR1 family protein